MHAVSDAYHPILKRVRSVSQELYRERARIGRNDRDEHLHNLEEVQESG